MCAGDDDQQTNYRWPNTLKVSKQTRSKQDKYIYIYIYIKYIKYIKYNIYIYIYI